ncbi:alkaline ceramidase family protein [Glonium stellatum]|uniref:Alkaline ceramidase family protein n=1 Tax=Glonium stellatum TaxID=574774 RepID=A0A8E2F4X8_9PEZI|nr:alkaline ceramidase family protein [Glonium stellatum]
MNSLFYRPYADSQENPVGAWGPPTSHANFCEEDYIITSYVAEFVNTLTNLTYILYGFYGLRRLRGTSNGLFSFLAFSYWGLVAVGVCSGYFHGTLKYHSQMSDDLSMLLATSLVLHRIFTFDASPTYRGNFAFGLLATLIPVSIYHCVKDEVVVHVVVFGAMIIAVGIKTREVIRSRIKERSHRRRVRDLERFGVACAALGYLLWNIDQHFCPLLTTLKRRVGLPFGMLLELHGWWHVLTAISAYIFMALVEYLTSGDGPPGDKIEEKFVWPVRSVLSDIEGKDE